MFAENIEAWNFGPVVRPVYDEFKNMAQILSIKFRK